MTNELIVVLCLLGATVVMFILNKPRMDAVALIMLTILPFTGAISMNDSLAGFSDPTVILIAALFVVGDGLVRTGIAQKLGDFLVKGAGNSETRLMALLMGISGFVGSIMSSTGVIAIFIPVILRICRNTGLAAGRLMMPLSMSALISGMITLVATPPNLVVNSTLVRHHHEGFGFFAFTPFGVPILILAIIYMLFARRWLGPSKSSDTSTNRRPHFSQWSDEYKLRERAHRFSIAPSSPWGGKKLADLDLRSDGINIITIERHKRFSTTIVTPLAETDLQPGDGVFLLISSPDYNEEDFCKRNGLHPLPLTGTYFTNHTKVIGMAEMMVPAYSRLIGKTIVESGFRSAYGLTVVGLKRGTTAMDAAIHEETLKAGDTLLVAGPWQNIRKINMTDQNDLIVINTPVEMDDVVPVPGRAPLALAAVAFMVAMMITGMIPNVQAALIACLLLGLFRCITMTTAYNSISWQSLMVIIGMLPFSIALQNTGGIDLAAKLMTETFGGAGPYTMLVALFVLTSLLGLFISNTATAVLVAPVAITVAQQQGFSPYPFCMIVALASSAAFMTPVSSPVNTLVVGPGKYKFMDFVKVGVPFTVIVMITSVILVPLVYPFSTP